MILKGENFRLVSEKIHNLQFHLTSFFKKRLVGRKLLAFFREYSATIVVAACVILVSFINLASAKGAKGSLFGYLGAKTQSDNLLKNKVAIQNERKNNLATAPLSEPGYMADAQTRQVEETYPSGDYALSMAVPTVQSQIVLASYSPQASGISRRELKTYEVKDGDTIGSIAAKNGISSNTIFGANNLDETSLIKPGDKLAILPVTGVKYKVQKGDNLDAIVTKYNADKEKIMAYNELPADEKLKDGQDLIIPDGYIAPPAATGTQLASATVNGQPVARTSALGLPQRQYASAAPSLTDARAGAGHSFPRGYCTWYVAQRKYVPWGGNAGAWLSNARASGKATGRTPKPGAIMVSGESRWGHVALVESVSGGSFTVSEMNYVGFGKKSTRTISTANRVVKGFIY